MDFLNTTQARFWLFPDEDIGGVRKQNITEVRDSLSGDIAKHCLSEEEERMLAADYERRILDLCGSLNLPDKVAITALVYFRRFYLFKSMMRSDPSTLWASCVFLACKTEEHRVPIATFARTVGVEPSLLAARERELLAGIRFHLQIQAPHTAVRGLIAELGATGAEGVSPDLLPRVL
eukprot:EC723058.1.p1 GENE.EC723058.1~~EC723058.1.p1  ORF type:complete len:178 (+),score=10.06 EC723058.1:71-604(+)